MCINKNNTFNNTNKIEKNYLNLIEWLSLQIMLNGKKRYQISFRRLLS